MLGATVMQGSGRDVPRAGLRGADEPLVAAYAGGHACSRRTRDTTGPAPQSDHAEFLKVVCNFLRTFWIVQRESDAILPEGESGRRRE